VAATLPFIDEKRVDLERLCVQHHVLRLDLFGSAAQGDFDPQHSDLDFLVELDDVPPGQRADRYFQLREDPQALFGRSVDLVVAAAVRNPYFRESIERSRIPIYVS
jgi:predicted nucleotidyltransferase